MIDCFVVGCVTIGRVLENKQCSGQADHSMQVCDEPRAPERPAFITKELYTVGRQTRNQATVAPVGDDRELRQKFGNPVHFRNRPRKNDLRDQHQWHDSYRHVSIL